MLGILGLGSGGGANPSPADLETRGGADGARTRWWRAAPSFGQRGSGRTVHRGNRRRAARSPHREAKGRLACSPGGTGGGSGGERRDRVLAKQPAPPPSG